MPRKQKEPKGDTSLAAVTDYRYKDKRKNNPPAKITAEGFVPVVSKAEYLSSPRRPPELRFDPTGAADELPNLLAKAAREQLTEAEARTLATALRVHGLWLEWAEHKLFTVDPVALHIHERVSTQAILKVAARDGDREQLGPARHVGFHVNQNPQLLDREMAHIMGSVRPGAGRN